MADDTQNDRLPPLVRRDPDWTVRALANYAVGGAIGIDHDAEAARLADDIQTLIRERQREIDRQDPNT